MSLISPPNGVFLELVHADLPDPPLTDNERQEGLIAARRLIQTKYDAGIPFFTKDLFRDVVRQFESNDNLDPKVSVTGLDGVTVDFPLRTGQEFQTQMYGDNYVCIRAKPELEYRSTEGLVATEQPDYRPVRLAYVPVEVVHSTELRHAQTNEPVSLWPASDYAIVRQRFEQAKRSLEASEHFAQLRSTLASVAIPPGINKIVAFACSTMTSAETQPTRSMAQHALALTIRDFLVSSYVTGADGEGAGEIKCYAQDPIYTPVDEQVLLEAGITVLDDPRAFLEVDEASAIISINPDIAVRQVIADIARPAIMIWNKVIVKDRAITTDPVSPRVEKMIEEYVELPFPDEVDLFGDIAIYIRKVG